MRHFRYPHDSKGDLLFRFVDNNLISPRREWLRFGVLPGIASLSAFGSRKALANEVAARKLPGFGKAKSVIIVFASGGQSQIDTWDPKPDAPVEIRGAFDSIATSVPGVRFCEHMPQIAKIADRFCLVRNMAHEDLDHGTAFYLANTGRYHRRRSGNPDPSPQDYPCMGSVLHKVRPTQDFVNTSVHLNGPAEVPKLFAPGQFGGFLGKGLDPLTLGNVMSDSMPIPELNPHADVPSLRLQRRQSLLSAIENAATSLQSVSTLSDKDSLYRQAFDMLSDTTTREAFDLSQEPDSVRDRYGRNRSAQACLLARRLVEAGVPFVNVIWNHSNRGQDFDTQPDSYGWDTHNDIFDALQNQLLPRFDQGFSALIEDLDERGLLDETLVVCMGEFGRAPTVALEKRFAGSSPGRKHWSWVYSIALAGAGVRPGTVVGASDSAGAYPVNEPYGPWDVMATIFSSLGIDPETTYFDSLSRPFRISEGKVMEAIYS